jgi:hypothetical protein
VKLAATCIPQGAQIKQYILYTYILDAKETHDLLSPKKQSYDFIMSLS